MADFFPGELADIPGFRDLYGRLPTDLGQPRDGVDALEAWADIDVRPILEAVRLPTLVEAVCGDRFAPLEASKALADSMPQARVS